MKHIDYMKMAVNLSNLCSISYNAYSVGAVIIDTHNNILSTGYSRECNKMHAEEVAFYKLQNYHIQYAIYTSMIPCSNRLSNSISCLELCIKYNIKIIYYGFIEPYVFTKNKTKDIIDNIGIDLVYIRDFYKEVLNINNHLI